MHQVALTKRIFNKTDNTTTPYQTSYIVLGYEWFSYHNMHFALHDGGRVRISDGNAWCASEHMLRRTISIPSF